MALTVVDEWPGDGGDDDVGTRVAAVDWALNALSALSFVDLALADQGALATALVRLRSRLDAVEAAVLAAFDAGGEWSLDHHRSAAVALSHRCRLSRSEARRRIRLARRLRDVPAVATALAAGDITGEHAQRLVDARRPGVEVEFDRDVDTLLGHARTLSYKDFLIVLRYWSDRADPDGAEEKAAAQVQEARAHISCTLDDQVVVDAVLDPIGGAIFATAVEQIEAELFNADWAEAAAIHGQDTTDAHLARTPAQRRAAAMVELAVRATATPPDAQRPAPLVNVIMDVDTFDAALHEHAGLAPKPRRPGTPVQCETLDGMVLTPRQAIELALAGHVRRVVYDTPNRITQISTRQRFYTGTLRQLLELRDRHCTHPGCDQPARRCEADHIDPWNPDNPNTTPANGRLLCAYHHRLRQRLKHPPTAERQLDGRLKHHRADGTPIPEPPRRWNVP